MEKEKNKKKRGLFTFIILAVLLGFLAGITGELVTRYYLSNLAFFRDLYFTDISNTSQRDIVIRDPKKVVVEQDLRIDQLKKEVESFVVNIYQKKSLNQSVANNVFLPRELQGQAVVMTSDGWLMTTEKVVTNINNSLVVASDKNIYEISDLVKDPATNMVWIKIDAQNLPVVDFAEISEINDGHQVFIYNSSQDLLELSNIKDKKYNPVSNFYDLVLSSQDLDRYILLSDSFSQDAISSPVFNSKSELIGLLYGSGSIINQVIPVNYFESIINQVLKSEEIKRPYLGINYISISDVDGLTDDQRQGQENGALLVANNQGVMESLDSPLGGELMAGDIILSIEDQSINQVNDLVDILLEYKSGQQVLIKYLHEGEEKEIDITL